MDLDEKDAHNHRIDTEMSDTRIEGEVIVTLNNPEQEAVPLQRLRRCNVVAQLRLRHVLMLSLDDFDICRVSDGMPNDVFGIVELKPTVVGVVAAKVCVDRIIHGADVAPAR